MHSAGLGDSGALAHSNTIGGSLMGFITVLGNPGQESRNKLHGGSYPIEHLHIRPCFWSKAALDHEMEAEGF